VEEDNDAPSLDLLTSFGKDVRIVFCIPTSWSQKSSAFMASTLQWDLQEGRKLRKKAWRNLLTGSAVCCGLRLVEIFSEFSWSHTTQSLELAVEMAAIDVAQLHSNFFHA
jgi:hypothetical protein